MSDTWFASKVWNSEKEDGCHPYEAHTLQTYFHGDMAVEEAAHRITLPIIHDFDPGASLHRLWSLLIDALTEVPSKQSQTVQLLKAMEHLPPLDLKHKCTAHLLQNRIVWRDLPGFGHLWADLHKDSCWRKHQHSYSPSQWADICDAYPKAAAIEAQLVAAEVDDIPLDWGLECVCDALESSDALFDVEVPAAKEWLSRVATPMRNFAGSSRALKRRNLWNGIGGTSCMTAGRWDFWKQRLRSFVENVDLSEEARAAASAALVAMDAV